MSPVTFDTLPERIANRPVRPLVIAYGMGVDSTAMLVALARKYRSGDASARPEAILFADTGGEKRETYAYEPAIQEYLADVGFPALVTVRYAPKHGKYSTLEENCLVNETLPSLAFGFKKCSLKVRRATTALRAWQGRDAMDEGRPATRTEAPPL